MKGYHLHANRPLEHLGPSCGISPLSPSDSSPLRGAQSATLPLAEGEVGGGVAANGPFGLKRFFAVVSCLLSLACGLFTACVEEDTFTDTPEGNLEALWQMIDQHYCFLPYKSEAIGLNWDHVRSVYRQRLSPSMSRVQLFEVLSEMLSELRDGHVNLYSSADMGRYWHWMDDYPPQWDHELRRAYLGQDYKIAAGLKYRILDDNIGYVVYESFMDAFGDGNLDDVLHSLRLCDGLILDIRGNGGGQLTNAEQLAARFTNERRLVGYISHKTGPAHDAFSQPQAEYVEPSRHIRWQKPVVVLTNRECYSAANAFVRNVKDFPLVTTLGDTTGGGSGLPFSSELPCGWAVRFSACIMYDAQMHHTEFGIEPDVRCELSPDDAARGIDTLIEAARRLLKGK